MKKLIKYCSVSFLALMMALVAGYGTAMAAGERTDTRTEGSQTGTYIDDTLITTKVKTAILDDASLSVFDIKVETQQGNVQLNGFVDSQGDINRATEVAQRIEGVKSVQNNLQLKSSQ